MARIVSGNTKLSGQKFPSTARIVGQEIPLTAGLHVVYIAAPGGDSKWVQVLKWVANWNRAWNLYAAAATKEWNLIQGKPGGLTLVMPKSGQYFRVKLDGKTVSIPRKGFDEKKKALFFLVELKA